LTLGCLRQRGVQVTNTAVELANHAALLTRDGREVPLDDCGALIIVDRGQMEGAVLVFRDANRFVLRRGKKAQAERGRLAELDCNVGIALRQGETLHALLQLCAEAILCFLDAALARTS
jgi:hypothetical protein